MVANPELLRGADFELQESSVHLVATYQELPRSVEWQPEKCKGACGHWTSECRAAWMTRNPKLDLQEYRAT